MCAISFPFRVDSEFYYQSVVKFESRGSSRSYILNRPAKLNALDDNMLQLLRPKIEVGLLAFPVSRSLFISFALGMGKF